MIYNEMAVPGREQAFARTFESHYVMNWRFRPATEFQTYASLSKRLQDLIPKLSKNLLVPSNKYCVYDFKTEKFEMLSVSAFKQFCAIGTLIFVTGCIPIKENIRDAQLIRADEGIVITRVVALGGGGQLSIGRDFGVISEAALTLNGNTGVRMITLNASDNVVISGYQAGGFQRSFAVGEFNFSVKAGVITYIGDIEINGKYSRLLHVNDNEQKTVAEARHQFPALFGKYPYQKSLIGKRTITESLETSTLNSN